MGHAHTRHGLWHFARFSSLPLPTRGRRPGLRCLAAAPAMIISLTVALAVSFLLYVCIFGGSSTGFIGKLHRLLVRCECFGLCFGRRCAHFLSRSEEVCCGRPNPLLQLFYLSLVLGGFYLFLLSTRQYMDNPRLAHYHSYAPYPAVGVAIATFVAASFSDPGTITPANLHRFSREPFDGVLYRPKM